MAKRMRVGIVFGGKSGEHEVSIQSAKSVMASLDPNKYETVPIFISKSGRWFGSQEATAILQGQDGQVARFLTTGHEGAGDGVRTELPVESETAVEVASGETVPSMLAQQIDVVLPILHGSNGEDGTIQGLLEVLDLPYVGAGVLASAVGMDKIFMKTVFAAAGLPQVEYIFFTRKQWQQDKEQILEQIEKTVNYPCFVKPANLGSSVGISKVKSRDQLSEAVDFAARYDRKVIVEEGREVREIEVAVLGNEQPEASVPGEVIPSAEFYDYAAKYLAGDSELQIPARVTPEQMQEIRQLAVRAFQAVDCSGLARVDFFIDKRTNQVLLNEINTMPGFTQFSMYPKLWEATGLPYALLIDKLIQLAIERHEEKSQNVTDFSAS